MADRDVDVLLIGGGIASANCARHLREEGFDGSILLAGGEPEPPYNRPPCSKGYLQGKESREETWFRPAEWWDENSIELLIRMRVMKLDTDAKVATLMNKQTVGYDKALIATGANVRILRVDGSALDGIHYLRTLGNADTIRGDVEDHEHVVLIGGSYIGCEVAASLTLLGKRCTIVMQEETTLETGFGKQAGRFFQSQLEEHGVTVIGADALGHFEGGDRVERVVTEAGRTIDCDAVVIGAGAVPDVMLAKAAGLELGESGGVRCSSQLETSAPGLFAAGDMCEYDSVVHGRRLRIEHWDVAFNQGRTAALNILGRGVDHDVIPYFFSDLADWTSLEYVGPASEWDQEVVRGAFDAGEFSVWYLSGGKVAAALSVGRSDDLEVARRLIADRTDVSDRTDVLADVDSALEEL
jgi:3-phenylpropionate/trans-cinnamate dioxygenase ferredoxin reductase subunit